MKSVRRRLFLFGSTAVAVAFVAGWGGRAAAVDDLHRQRQTASADYREKLEGLAKWCLESGLPEQAQKTRAWLPPAHPRLRYVHLPPRRLEALNPPADLPAKEKEWLDQLATLRRKQADRLLELARGALATDHVSLAVELANEALRENPDHKELRRIFGYVEHEGDEKFKTWRTPYEVAQLRKGLIWHDRFGWLAKDDVPRYEAGERLLDNKVGENKVGNKTGDKAGRKWVTAAADADAHAEIRQGWKIETEHFSLLTNDGLESGVALAQRLERLHEAWRQLFVGYRLTKAQILEAFKLGGKTSLATLRPKYNVTYFRNQDEYRRDLRGEIPEKLTTAGIYLGSKRRAYFYHDESGDGTTLYHEVTHQLFSESRQLFTVGQKSDFWIVEGIACYMESLAEGETAVLPGVAERFVCFGGIDAARVQDARYYLVKSEFYLPLVQLTRLGMADLQKHPQIGRVYAQSAATTDFLMHANDGKYRDGLISYIKGVYEGRAASLASHAAAPLSTLDNEYSRFQQLTDADLAALRPGGSPKYLALCGTRVTDRGLDLVQPLGDLEWIDLYKTAVTNAGVAKLAGLTKLRQLDLSGTRVTDAGLRHVGRLTGLQNLMLGATPITDDGLRELGTLKQLAQLTLWNTNITDAGLAHLGAFPNLRHLDLSGCAKISDEGLPRLVGLKTLETLDLTKTAVTGNGAKRLQATLPKCKITQ